MSQKSNQYTPKSVDPLAAFIFNLNKYFRLSTIVYLPVLLSVVVLVIGFLLGEQIYQDTDVPPKFIGAVFLIMSLIASITGFIQIVIREVPGLILPVRGKVAIFIGIVWVVCFGLLAIGIVRYYFLY